MRGRSRRRRRGALVLVACLAGPGCFTTNAVRSASRLVDSPHPERRIAGGFMFALTPVTFVADVLLWPWSLYWLLQQAG